MNQSDHLILENQLCFRLYSLTKLMNRHYSPVLKKLGLTYPQYLVMLVLWQHNNTQHAISVKELGEKLDLDSGTLSPLLKRLEKQALINRIRNSEDERRVELNLTKTGILLEAQAQTIPAQMFAVTGMSLDELHSLTKQLDCLLATMKTQ